MYIVKKTKTEEKYFKGYNKVFYDGCSHFLKDIGEYRIEIIYSGYKYNFLQRKVLKNSPKYIRIYLKYKNMDAGAIHHLKAKNFLKLEKEMLIFLITIGYYDIGNIDLKPKRRIKKLAKDFESYYKRHIDVFQEQFEINMQELEKEGEINCACTQKCDKITKF